MVRGRGGVASDDLLDVTGVTVLALQAAHDGTVKIGRNESSHRS
jgi:hypothetical protein